MSRIVLAFKSFFALLFSGKLPEEVTVALNLTRRIVTPPASAAPQSASKPAAPEGPKPADGAVQILAILQREARLVDFLMEDIAPYTDEQVGAAVRDVHKQCRAVLERHLRVAPVVDGVEGTMTTLATVGLKSGDTDRLKIVGNVPPDGKVEAGVLRHRGWRVEKVELPSTPTGKKAQVLAPAEVEVE